MTSYGMNQAASATDGDVADSAGDEGFECARLRFGTDTRRSQNTRRRRRQRDGDYERQDGELHERSLLHGVSHCFGGIIDRLIAGLVRKLSRSFTEQKK